MSYEQGVAMGQEYVRPYKPHRKQAYWQGPPAAFTRFRRINPAGAPVIAGHAAILEANGQLTSCPGALIAIDAIHTQTDAAGNFVVEVPAARHNLRIGGIGLLWSEAPPLQVQQGDSIRIHVSLLPDFRPLID